jgi:hypothetical protein
VKTTPYIILKIVENKKDNHILYVKLNIKNIPKNNEKFLINLNKCQPSVNPTNNVFENKNLSPSKGFPFLYLFFQDISGFQNNSFLNDLKIEL